MCVCDVRIKDYLILCTNYMEQWSSVALSMVAFRPSRLIFKDGVVPEQLRGLFPDVAQAMFVLFLVMNGDMDPISELLGSYPLTQFFTAVFVVISNWAILAIFTAVVGENMITSVEDRRAKQELLESADRTERSVVKLRLALEGL